MSKSITFVGNGKMALALAKGLCEANVIEVIGRSMGAMEQFERELRAPVKKTLYSSADITNKTVILCVKPSNLSEVAPLLKGTAQTLYSVLAGTPLSALKSIQAHHYCRAMPNLAAEAGASMTSLVGDDEISANAIALFNTIGTTLWLNSEKELDIATALAGSGPAYLALIAEALCDGAVREGLKRDDAMVLMRGLFDGFGKLIQTVHPAILKDNVMSPGGTTAAGYGALEKGNVREGCMEAIRAAHGRAKEMK
ncbi:pyrroline-5-carboxylate reductase [Sulfuricurvum sp.]|uniref:pyrroline-5-carboxylate reductase n=1 Tax=Sulfuricurvum sp. TaxID=2025608 RepID=UPI002622FA2D|nr:pyrroline-5-carboxylate reductase [Sulfuricurvum sp.]MDD2265549.1 pyrroline-5-carboxylate reductase [Sulfuricurvum sp.]MDD2783202.1 pyrroline-5-carboxylate reductase [Sulfuricurvum sp.]HZF71286.1 pyrroline-5-carboxylate reductase [Sulfuricurvum sp.]